MEPSQNLSTLFEKFLVYLQSEPVPPEFLGEAPIDVPPDFDPYQMVAEWVALRHELKQQGKLLRSAQDAFQQGLTTIQTQPYQVSEQPYSSLTSQPSHSFFNKEQESLLKDLLNVIDAIDQACDHWQDIQTIHQPDTQTLGSKPRKKTKPWWQLLLFWWKPQKPIQHSSGSTTDLELLNSSREGLNLIRQNLLDLLRLRQVIPMEALGNPFDAHCMYAIGRETTHELPPNTVVREVVRGYYWGDRILREAQVIVAASTENK